MEAQDVEQTLARHRRELKDLQGRITNKKKNASKKTRKGINEECAEMERVLRERQAGELAAVRGGGGEEEEEEDAEEEMEPDGNENGSSNKNENDSNDKNENNGDENTEAAGPGPGPGPAPRKRNRQKERMARRAAEHEAASAQAHAEASRMTDHRARESAYMRRAFAEHGLVEQDIAPDGHCLFSAVADQLREHGMAVDGEQQQQHQDQSQTQRQQRTADGDKGPEAAYKLVRRAAAEYITAHADDFAPFMEEDLGAYVARMRDTAEWGGQLELMALARRYGVEIRVIQDGRTERIAGGEGEGGRTFWLAYYRHGYGLGEHYNSLRVKSTAKTTTAATMATMTTTTTSKG